MLNKKGASFIDLMVGLVLLLGTLTMMFQFQSYLKRHQYRQNVNMAILQTLNNETQRAYRSPDWVNLKGVNTPSKYGEITSTFTDYDVTPYHTEHLTLSVSMGEFEESVDIERSVFWIEK